MTHHMKRSGRVRVEHATFSLSSYHFFIFVILLLIVLQLLGFFATYHFFTKKIMVVSRKTDHIGKNVSDYFNNLTYQGLGQWLCSLSNTNYVVFVDDYWTSIWMKEWLKCVLHTKQKNTIHFTITFTKKTVIIGMPNVWPQNTVYLIFCYVWKELLWIDRDLYAYYFPLLPHSYECRQYTV